MFRSRKSFFIVLLHLPFIFSVFDVHPNTLQCYKKVQLAETTADHKSKPGLSPSECIAECASFFYRFSILQRGHVCVCANEFTGTATDESACTSSCIINTERPCGNGDNNLFVVFKINNTVPGPPTDLFADKITETSLELHWKPPINQDIVTGYSLTAHIIHTYAPYLLNTLQWQVDKGIYQFSVYELHPGSTYNFSVQAIAQTNFGISRSIIIDTLIGEPDPSPDPPTIVRIDNNQVKVKIWPSINENGPVSAYRLIVMSEKSDQGYIPEQLKSYDEARKDGLNFYIAAEIQPLDIDDEFTLGDGKYYNGFYNAPLNSTENIDVSIGVVSRKNNRTLIRYAELSTRHKGVIILNVGPTNNSDSLNKTLVIAIVLMGGLLVCLIGIWIFLKYKLQTQRNRTPECQELTLQGPILEMENSGYVPEEELERVSHYESLRNKVWNIPKNFLDIHLDHVIGTGKYGRIVSGLVKQENNTSQTAIYVIPDHKLRKSESKEMLKQLNMLIISGKHDNIMALIGFYENPTTLYIVMEYYELDLKEWLLSSRILRNDQIYFTHLTQDIFLNIFLHIGRGMEHFSNQKLVHKQLCCRKIYLNSYNLMAKIGGFGLLDFNKDNQNWDYTRWSAHEVFRQRTPSTKSDVWSFGCLLWEACTLGGTPFVQIPTNNVANEIRRGVRLPQLQYFSNDIYQIMLNCWQLDSDERPTFKELVQNLEMLLMNGDSVIDSKLYDGFNYAEYNLAMELN